MTNKTSKHIITFSNGQSAWLIVTEYPTIFVGELILSNLINTGKKSFTLPVKDFKADSLNGLLIIVEEFLKCETSFDFIIKFDSNL